MLVIPIFFSANSLWGFSTTSTLFTVEDIFLKSLDWEILVFCDEQGEKLSLFTHVNTKFVMYMKADVCSH